MPAQNQSNNIHSGKPNNATQTETVLRTENLSVYYGDTLALRDVSLEIPKNNVTEEVSHGSSIIYT